MSRRHSSAPVLQLEPSQAARAGMEPLVEVMAYTRLPPDCASVTLPAARVTPLTAAAETLEPYTCWLNAVVSAVAWSAAVKEEAVVGQEVYWA